MLVLNAYLHPQDPQYPVFDLMCVPSVMQRKCKGSKMPGAGLLQSPLPVVEDGCMGLRLCNSESPLYRDLFEGMFKTLRVFAPSSSEFIPFLICHYSITIFEINAFLNQDSSSLCQI